MAGERPRVVYWLKMPTPYFVERLNAIAALGAIDVEAWFDQEREPDRSWEVDPSSWRFRARYIPARKLAGLSMHLPAPELREVRPDLLVQECDRGHLVLGFLLARAIAARTAFRQLPNYDSWSDRTWWRELGKHFVFRAVDGAKVPGEDGRAFAEQYGLPASRAFAVIQSIAVDHFGRAQQVEQSARQARREQLGLRGCVFAYVGRLWSGKGLDYLFEAYNFVRQRQPEVSLLLVGDGVDEPRYRRQARDMPGVVFAGFVQGRDLPGYYALADVFVFPTLGDPNGLVVEEAMAAGLPVVCTEAAGDIRRRLPDGEAGFVVPVAQSGPLGERMLRLANVPELRHRLADTAQQLAGRYHHNNYARDFSAFVAGVLSLPARRTLAARVARVLGRCAFASLRPSGGAAPYVQTGREATSIYRATPAGAALPAGAARGPQDSAT